MSRRAAFIDLLARRHATTSHAPPSRPRTGAQEIVTVRGGLVVGRVGATSTTPVVDVLGSHLSALAAAFSQRLMQDGGLAVTPVQAERYSRILQEDMPRSRRSLYYLTRETFVTDGAQLETFNRLFAETFGEPAGADRYREDATAMPIAAI